MFRSDSKRTSLWLALLGSIGLVCLIACEDFGLDGPVEVEVVIATPESGGSVATVSGLISATTTPTGNPPVALRNQAESAPPVVQDDPVAHPPGPSATTDELGESRKNIETLLTNIAMPTDVDKALPHYDKGRGFLYRVKDYDKAIEQFNRAIELDPKLVDAYTNRGLAYSEKGDHARALADHNKALELEPGSIFAYTSRGKALAGMGDHEKAMADHDAALEMDTDEKYEFLIQTNRGHLYVEMGDLPRALEAFTEAVRTTRHPTVSHTNRGNVYMALGDYQSALGDYSTARSYDRDSPVLLLNLGLIPIWATTSTP